MSSWASGSPMKPSSLLKKVRVGNMAILNNRRTTYLRLAALLAGFTVTVAMARQPNVIYINTDDWGIGKVPC